MKAVILNSGIGKRMGEYTASQPKCLVEVADRDTILSRQVRQLLSCGIDNILITTGPFEEKIKDYLAETFPGVTFEYVRNPLYETTNYIYSLLVARDFLQEDILLLHGDLVFEDTVLNKLLASSRTDAVLINESVALPEKDFKGRVIDGLVREISIDIFDEYCSFLIPMYKLSQQTVATWLQEMDNFAKENRLNVYAENALNNLLEHQVALYPVYYTDEFCMEIDNPEDLELAKSKIASL